MATVGHNAPQNITPFLWFNGGVEDALKFYTDVFPNSEIVSQHRLPAEVPGQSGKVLTATFRLNGLEFMAIDGGPAFSFTMAISFFVKCETQQEVDHYWEKLSADGGKTSQCGWLTDKFGVSWQIVPNILGKLMYSASPEKAKNVMNAMLKMTKLDIAGLEAAYKG